MFIVFEGIDGSGKTTVSKLFAEKLKGKNKKVLWTNEPNSDTDFGLDIRSILKKHETKLDNLTELLLFSASRVEHIKNVIEPALKENKTVISDRYYYSTVAYQGFAGNMEKNILSAVNGAVFNKFPIYPDIVFWIDTDIDTCMQRSKKTDAKDMMSKEYYERCREYYSHLYNNGESYTVSHIIRIDGNQALDKVVEDVLVEYSKYCFKESIHLRVAAADICELFENLQ